MHLWIVADKRKQIKTIELAENVLDLYVRFHSGPTCYVTMNKVKE
jgi:hypothetical protein